MNTGNLYLTNSKCTLRKLIQTKIHTEDRWLGLTEYQSFKVI